MENLQISFFNVKTKIGVFSKNNHTTIWDASNHDKYVLRLNHSLYLMYNTKNKVLNVSTWMVGQRANSWYEWTNKQLELVVCCPKKHYYGCKNKVVLSWTRNLTKSLHFQFYFLISLFGKISPINFFFIIPKLRPTLFNMFLVISWGGNVKVVEKWIWFY
jgi:hypothetical protein